MLYRVGYLNPFFWQSIFIFLAFQFF